MKHDDNNLSKALKFVKTCHEKYLNDESVNDEPSQRCFVRVEEKGNAKLLKLEKQCSSSLLMYEK